MSEDAVPPQRATQLLEELRESFSGGDFERMADCFETPIPIYTLSGMRLLLDRRMFCEAVAAQRRAYRALDVARIDLRLTAVSLDRPQRLKVAARWLYLFKDGRDTLHTDLTYFCNQSGSRGGLSVQMVEYHSFALDYLGGGTS